ncbi:MAG: dTMP kinase [bacterium]
MSTPGKFITLEGSEGAGKSTSLDALCRHLRQAGIDVYQTREPGGTPMAEAIREVMLSDWQEDVAGLTELLLVFAARHQHISHEIKPRLAKGQWVVCDRFTDATYAYQGVARGTPLDYVTALENWVQGDLRPDLTLYLDIDPEIGHQRIAGREQDRMENEQVEFFHAVRTGYLQRVATRTTMQLIDASLSIKEVQTAMFAIVDPFIERYLA